MDSRMVTVERGMGGVEAYHQQIYTTTKGTDLGDKLLGR